MVNKVAIFAGGCFWGIQKQFDDFKKENKGILETIVGYCGGNIKKIKRRSIR
jgi:peptide methionine sulfoxide reductase MsrA